MIVTRRPTGPFRAVEVLTDGPSPRLRWMVVDARGEIPHDLVAEMLDPHGRTFCEEKARVMNRGYYRDE